MKIDDVWGNEKPHKEFIAEYCDLLVEEQFKDIKTRLDIIELKLDVVMYYIDFLTDELKI